MNSWTFNKIAGAVLGTALLVFGLKGVTGLVYHPLAASTENPGYKIEVAESAPAGGESSIRSARRIAVSDKKAPGPAVSQMV